MTKGTFSEPLCSNRLSVYVGSMFFVFSQVLSEFLSKMQMPERQVNDMRYKVYSTSLIESY